MPTLTLAPIGAGASSDWGVVGTLPGGELTAWEAVNPESDDTTYISTATVGAVTNLDCGGAGIPYYGRVLGLSIGYRGRQTGGTYGDGEVLLSVMHGVTLETIASATVALNWSGTKLHFQRESWSGSGRLALEDVQDLKIQIEAVSVPAGFALAISQLWFEVEYAEAPTVYDPMESGVFPDDPTLGPKEFAKFGNAPVLITPQEYLRIDDNDDADYLMYILGNTEIPEYNKDHVTEIETRVIMTNPTTLATMPMYAIWVVDDVKDIELAYVKINNEHYLGLTSINADHADPDDYLDIVPMNLAVGRDVRIALRIDRNDDARNMGSVTVTLDGEPTLEAPYHKFATQSPGASTIAFGARIPTYGEIRIDTDYFAWRTYRRQGGTFRSWEVLTPGVNRISTDRTDTDIVPVFFIDPPGIHAGQSQQACVLDVQDPTEVCEISQMTQIEDGTNYKVEVDYKMNGVVGEGELVVQRLQDLYFWEEGVGWSSTFKSVTLANITDRGRFSAMSGINVGPDYPGIRITIRRKTDTGSPYKILVYKVFLGEE